MSTQRIPYTIPVPTAYGTMLVNRHDINQTNALIKSGIALDYQEILIIKKLLDTVTEPHKVFVDVGANIGTHSVALAQHLGDDGTVYSFEPQRILFQMVCGSLALNSLTNTHCYNLAVGREAGAITVPRFDYFKPLNFGSVEFGGQQNEKLDQEPSTDGPEERVSVVSLDSFGWPKVHFLKIDAEGMEFDILDGAAETIRRCSPYMLVEYLKVDKGLLAERLKAFGYSIYDVTSNYLAVPKARQGDVSIQGLPTI